MGELKSIALGAGERYVLTGGQVHLPSCEHAQHVDGAGGHVDSLERAQALGFPPCPVCLSERMVTDGEDREEREVGNL